MAIPVFLQGSFRYKETAGVTDVDTIVSDLLSEMAMNGVWTDQGGNVLRSPVDAWGRYARLALTRNTATDLGVSITDHAGATVCAGKILIDAGGTTVRCFTGPEHCVVESVRTTPEHFLFSRSFGKPGAVKAKRSRWSDRRSTLPGPTWFSIQTRKTAVHARCR